MDGITRYSNSFKQTYVVQLQRDYKDACVSFKEHYLNLPDRTVHTIENAEILINCLKGYTETIQEYLSAANTNELLTTQTQRQGAFKLLNKVNLALISSKIEHQFLLFYQHAIPIDPIRANRFIAQLDELWQITKTDELHKNLLEDLSQACDRFSWFGIETSQLTHLKAQIKQRLNALKPSTASSSSSSNEEKKAPAPQAPQPKTKTYQELSHLQSEIQALLTSRNEPSLEEIIQSAESLLATFNNNFPFQFPKNIDPNRLLKNLILAALRLEEVDKPNILTNDTFRSLLELSLIQFIPEIDHKLHNNRNGFYYALNIAQGGGRLSQGPEAVYTFLRDFGFAEQNATLDHSFTFEELTNYVKIAQLYIESCKHNKTSNDTQQVYLLHTLKLLDQVRDPLNAHSAQRGESHPSKVLTILATSLSQQATSLLKIIDEDRYSIIFENEIPPEGVDSHYIFQLFLKNPDKFLSSAFKYFSTHLMVMRAERNTLNINTRVIEFGTTCIKFISKAKTLELQKKNLSELNSWQDAILAFMLNSVTDAKIYAQQNACQIQLKSLETQLRSSNTFEALVDFKAKLEKFRQIHENSFNYLSNLHSCSSKTQQAIEEVNNLYEIILNQFLKKNFQIAVAKAKSKTQAIHSQFNLPGLNLFGNLEIPTKDHEGPSKSACGTIAAYATYFQMRQNLSPENNPAPPLESIMHYGTSRYQVLQRKLELEPQIQNLQVAIEESSEEYNQLKDEVIENVDQERRFLHPEDLFSEIGFAKLFTFNPAHILQTNLKVDAHNQYTSILTNLTELVPVTDPVTPSNQIGAILNIGNTFTSIVVTQTNNTPSAYSVTFTESHGSWNPSHGIHHNKAFQITFSSLKDAGQFLSVHAPFFKDENTSNLVDVQNTVTLYPVSLKGESQSATSQLEEDSQYVNKVKVNQRKRRQSTVENQVPPHQNKKVKFDTSTSDSPFEINIDLPPPPFRKTNEPRNRDFDPNKMFNSAKRGT